MRTKLVWIGALSLGFAACNENKDSEAEAPAIPERRPAALDRTASLKPTRPSAPSDMRLEETEVLTETEVVEEPMAGVITPAPPSSEEVEAQQAEREARRAEQREQRVAQVTEQMTTRLKERDADGDGLLSKEELSGRMQRRFDTADADGDGFLDASEQEAMIQETAERMSEFNRDRGGRGFGGGGGGGGRGFGGGGPGGRGPGGGGPGGGGR